MKRVIGFSVGLVAGAAGAYWGLNSSRQEKVERNDTFANLSDDYEKKKKELEDNLFKYGQPVSSLSLHFYKSHCLEYDRAKRIPLWTIEKLTKNNEVKANRNKSIFQPDETLPLQFSATNADYLESGWSRGHMAAAGNYKHCQESMDDTFYLTNILPQDLDNNSNYWYRIESYCRRLAKRYDVLVISGPLFLPEESEKKTIKYQVIGDNNVSVPTHLFKIILAEQEDEQPPLLGSFIVPNSPIKEEIPLTDFQVPLQTIERHSGTQYFPLLQLHKVLDLCENEGCKLMSQEKVNLYRFAQKIRRADSVQNVEQLWTELQSKGLEPDKYLQETYSMKLDELKKKII